MRISDHLLPSLVTHRRLSFAHLASIPGSWCIALSVANKLGKKKRLLAHVNHKYTPSPVSAIKTEGTKKNGCKCEAIHEHRSQTLLMRCTLTRSVALSHWCLHAEHANDLQLVWKPIWKKHSTPTPNINVHNLLQCWVTLLVRQVPCPILLK